MRVIGRRAAFGGGAALRADIVERRPHLDLVREPASEVLPIDLHDLAPSEAETKAQRPLENVEEE
jgi:hypothetical protein